MNGLSFSELAVARILDFVANVNYFDDKVKLMSIGGHNRVKMANFAAETPAASGWARIV
jgi:hypothetical protein